MSSPIHEHGDRQQIELPFAKVLVIMSTMILSMFLVSLDRTIIGVAIPSITDDFHSIDDIGWYGSAYMLTSASFQLLFGRLYRNYPVKVVLITSILVFEIGSAVCGAAPNSFALIFGRAIAGAGAAGIFSGGIQVMLAIIPLYKRPMWQAAFGMVFGVSAALGPLIGGALTQKVSWRWCFYINLPVGGLAIVVILLFFKVDHMRKACATTLLEQIKQLDPIGFVLAVPCIVSLLLALQYGGFAYAWSDGKIIALWVVFGVTFLAFVASQCYTQDVAMLPPRVFLQRSVFGGFWYMFFLASSMMIMVYYIPIWFQVVKGSPALTSSYQTLPSIISLVVASILAGLLARKVGYYTPQMMLAPLLSAIGVGLMTTWTPSTASPMWIGYQFLYGFGLGLGMQGSSLAVQTVLPQHDVPLGVAAIFFAQQIGGAIFVSVAENLLANKLKDAFSKLPDLNGKTLASLGATEVSKAVPPSLLPAVVDAYNDALHNVWYAALALTCAMVVPFAFIEWKNVKKQSQTQKEQEQGEQKGSSDEETAS